MERTFETWAPAGDLAPAYDVESVTLRHGLSVCLIPDGVGREAWKGQRLLLHWDAFIGVQVSNETCREDCWVSNRQDAGTFFISADSRYLQAYRERSCLFPEHALHFLISGTDTIVDVLSSAFPDVAITAP